MAVVEVQIVDAQGRVVPTADNDVAFTLARRIWSGERITQPHRGHLYQVAQRSGVPATIVTLVHWGFAVLGGAASLVFLNVEPSGKLLVLVALIVPQLTWLAYVISRARREALDSWG